MKVIVYNQEGKEVGNTVLPKEIFDVAMNSDLVHQVVVTQSANRRRIIANAKDRSQVRGGGKKPWKQKGTGRARHGSIRSPLWKGGGVTFGPTKERVFSKIVPKKLRRKALFMVLSAKVKSNLLFILDELTLPQSKTKMVEKIMNKFPFKKDSCLIALPSLDKNFILASRNLPRIITMQAKDLNCIDLLTSKYLVMSKESVKIIKDTMGK